MTVKNGFLLVEALLGLCFTSLLFCIITYYIGNIKNIQQETLSRLEMLLIARNAVERAIVFQESGSPIIADNKYSLMFTDKKIVDNFSRVCTMAVEKNDQKSKKSLSLCVYKRSDGR